MDDRSRSWFCVFNWPEKHGYSGTPVEVCERLKEEWCTTSTRSGAWAYCVSPTGLEHVHMVLEDTVVMRFSKIKKIYAVGMHFEATKGNKEQAEAYINKTGPYEEKGEKVLYSCSHGEIKGAQGKRSDLAAIEDMLESGYNPQEILFTSFSYYRFETMIKRSYFDRRDRETDSVREVKVIWHTGESGSGKSYSRIALEKDVGAENIFYLTDYSYNSMFDGYFGQPILWIEDFKCEIYLSTLLRLLDVYKCELHARYANGKSLWNEVHITSILHPRAAVNIYRDRLKTNAEYHLFKDKELLRRISVIRYHFVFNGQFLFKDFPVSLDERGDPIVPSMEQMRKDSVCAYPPSVGNFAEIANDDEITGG